MIGKYIMFAAAILSACGVVAKSQVQPVSVCLVANKTKELAGKELLIRGHFFQGKEGAMVYENGCKAYLVVWGAFDRPQSMLSSKGRFNFHGRIEQRSGLGLDGQRSGLVLVVDHASPAS